MLWKRPTIWAAACPATARRPAETRARRMPVQTVGDGTASARMTPATGTRPETGHAPRCANVEAGVRPCRPTMREPGSVAFRTQGISAASNATARDPPRRWNCTMPGGPARRPRGARAPASIRSTRMPAMPAWRNAAGGSTTPVWASWTLPATPGTSAKRTWIVLPAPTAYRRIWASVGHGFAVSRLAAVSRGPAATVVRSDRQTVADTTQVAGECGVVWGRMVAEEICGRVADVPDTFAAPDAPRAT